MLTEKERQSALNRLTRTRQALLDAVDGVTDNQARWNPAPDRWSIGGESVGHRAVRRHPVPSAASDEVQLTCSPQRMIQVNTFPRPNEHPRRNDPILPIEAKARAPLIC